MSRNSRPKYRSSKAYYTDGTELRRTSNGEPFIGFYHFYKGAPWTGPEHNSDSKLLADIAIGKDAFVFRNIADGFKKDLLPIELATIFPTEEEYEEGFVLRYFIRKRNTGEIVECSEKSYKYYSKTDSVEKQNFEAIQMEWKISGPLHDVKDEDGTITKYGVEDTNLRTVNSLGRNFREFLVNLPLAFKAKITS